MLYTIQYNEIQGESDMSFKKKWNRHKKHQKTKIKRPHLLFYKNVIFSKIIHSICCGKQF